MTIQSEIETLFDAYLSAWNSRDFDAMVAFFAEPMVYFLPGKTVVVPDRVALLEMLKGQFADLEREGFSHTEIEEVSARLCNETTAMVDLKNVARLRADGSAVDVLDAVYVCTKQADRWYLGGATVCQPGWNDE